MAADPEPGAYLLELADVMDGALQALDALDKPVVAQVQGVAAGAGMALMLAADVVVSARSARYLTAYAGIGLTPDCGLPWLLPRAVGQQRALELMLTGRWWLFQWELTNGASLAEARTAAMNVVVVVQAFYLFSCRSLTQSAWRIGVFSNRWILGGVAMQAVGQLAISYLPAMNAVFHTAPIGLEVWARIFVIAMLASLVVGIDKFVRRPRG